MESVKLTMRGAGLSYEKEINEELAGQIVAYLSSRIGREEVTSTELLSPVSQRASLLSDIPVSIGEYMDRYSPKTIAEKILVIANFLKEHGNRDIFQTNDVKALFRDAGEVPPGNFGRDFNQVIGNSWIAEDTTKRGNYYITKTGMSALSEGFSNGSPKKNGRRKVTKRRQKTQGEGSGSDNKDSVIVSVVDKIKDCDESERIEKNVLDKVSVPNRILLPFYICNRYFSGQGLTTGDVAKITSELGVSIAVGNVSHRVVNNPIKGYLSGDKVRKQGIPVTYKLNRKGVQYFESVLNDDEEK